MGRVQITSQSHTPRLRFGRDLTPRESTHRGTFAHCKIVGWSWGQSARAFPIARQDCSPMKCTTELGPSCCTLRFEERKSAVIISVPVHHVKLDTRAWQSSTAVRAPSFAGICRKYLSAVFASYILASTRRRPCHRHVGQHAGEVIISIPLLPERSLQTRASPFHCAYCSTLMLTIKSTNSGRRRLSWGVCARRSPTRTLVDTT